MTVSPLEQLLIDQLRYSKLPSPETEYRFHPTRRWRFDLAWPDLRFAVEVQGGTWVSGRHSRGAGFEKDCEKYGEATVLGWRVVNVTSNMVRDGRALTLIERCMRAVVCEP